jgi:hypothetical protein
MEGHRQYIIAIAIILLAFLVYYNLREKTQYWDFKVNKIRV